MSALTTLLDSFRNQARSEREKGTYFEELVRCYFQHEPMYRELYSEVLTYAEWAKREGRDGRDVGIDLVALERGTGDVHAIQCKLYAPDYRVQRSDIDSFFTVSGQRPFAHRLLVTTTNNWSEHAESALFDQRPPVTKIDLHALEASAIDWVRFQPRKAPTLKAKKALRPHQKVAVEAVERGLAAAARGKLIMACGTGKTFTSLKIAEELMGPGHRVLFLVPSLALLSQTLTEWTHESATPLQSFAVCSAARKTNQKTGEQRANKVYRFVYGVICQLDPSQNKAFVLPTSHVMIDPHSIEGGRMRVDDEDTLPSLICWASQTSYTATGTQLGNRIRSRPLLLDSCVRSRWSATDGRGNQPARIPISILCRTTIPSWHWKALRQRLDA